MFCFLFLMLDNIIGVRLCFFVFFVFDGSSSTLRVLLLLFLTPDIIQRVVVSVFLLKYFIHTSYLVNLY